MLLDWRWFCMDKTRDRQPLVFTHGCVIDDSVKCMVVLYDYFCCNSRNNLISRLSVMLLHRKHLEGWNIFQVSDTVTSIKSNFSCLGWTLRSRWFVAVFHFTDDDDDHGQIYCLHSVYLLFWKNYMKRSDINHMHPWHWTRLERGRFMCLQWT